MEMLWESNYNGSEGENVGAGLDWDKYEHLQPRGTEARIGLYRDQKACGPLTKPTSSPVGSSMHDGKRCPSLRACSEVYDRYVFTGPRQPGVLLKFSH